MAQGPTPDAAGAGRRWASIAMVALLALGVVWWTSGDHEGRSERVDERVTGPERVQPLDWIAFDEPPGAWVYDRISATTTIGSLGDRSMPGDVANLEISVEPAGRELSEVWAVERRSFEAEGIAAREVPPGHTIPGTDAAVRLVASATDEEVAVDIVVLLLAVDDRVVRFVIGSAGGPSMADLRAASDSVIIDRELLLDQLR